MLKKQDFFFLSSFLFGIFGVIVGILGQKMLAYITVLMSIVIFLLFLLCEDIAKEVKCQKQIFILGALVIILGMYLNEGRSEIKVGALFLIVSLTIVVISYFVRDYKQIKRVLQENWGCIIVILVFIMFSLPTIGEWEMWDARVYYAFPYGLQDIQRILKNLSFSEFYNLYLGGHASLGYSVWLMLFLRFYEGVEVVQIANIFLATFSIVAYYQILKKLLGIKYTNVWLALATMPFAFSPYILGMLGNINVDSATMYFGIIFIACSLYNWKYMELIFATMFCFTKETAVLYYIIYILLKIVIEYLGQNKFHIWKLIKFALTDIKNYIYALPVATFIILWLLNPNGGWSNGDNTGIVWNSNGMHCFGFNKELIFMKFKQVFLLNFNWLFWGAILFCIVVSLKKRIVWKNDIIEKMIPIESIGAMVIVLGCLFITPTHARYIVPLIPILYLGSSVAIANMKKIIFGIWHLGVTILLLISCFYMIDPLTEMVFPSMLVGSQKIYSMSMYNQVDFNDCIVYNRQYSYWGKTLLECLNVAGYDGEMQIVVTGGHNSKRYNVFGDHETLWNKKEKRMEYYDETIEIPKDCVLMNINEVASFEQEYQNKELPILYIVPFWDEKDDAFIIDKKIIKQGKVTYKGYILSYMILKNEFI
jgi:hypothetical protein